MIEMARSAAAGLGLLLLSAAGAWAQVMPNIDMLEGQIIHWVGPQTRALQDASTEGYYRTHTHDMVMPFAPVTAANCRMSKAVLIVRRDGTGEFDATTMTLAPNVTATWHTTISIFDAHGQPLFGTGDFAGPEMNDGKARTPYVWVNKFTMDRPTMLKIYDEIDHASLSYVC